MDIVTLGELLIDMFPGKIGQRIGQVDSFIPKPGGAPANVAVAARRLGAQSAFIGKVGDDLFGHYLKKVLDAEGVDTRGICFDKEARTTMAIITLLDENNAEFVFYRNPGADQRLEPGELDLDLIGEAKSFHFGSLSLTDEPSRSATKRALEAAKASGCLVSFDVNYRPALWPEPAAAIEQVMEIIPLVDLLKVNEHEITLLTKEDQISPEHRHSLDKAAFALLQRGPDLVVVTLGKDGSYFHSRQGSAYIPPIRVNSVDATGCGDAFIAGLLTELTKEERSENDFSVQNLRRKLRYANAVGALTSLTRGVIPALPYKKDVANFLKQNPQ